MVDPGGGTCKAGFREGLVIPRHTGTQAHRPLLAGLGALALLVVGLVVVFVYAGLKQDDKAGLRERVALLASLKAHETIMQQALATSQDEQATLDALSTGNLAQVHQRYGRRLNDGFGFEFVYITDAKGNVLYASERGKLDERRAYDWIKPAIERALADGRTMRSGIVSSRDGSGLMVARPFTQTTDALKVEQPLVAVTVDVVDPAFLQAIAAPANIQNVELRADPAKAPPPRLGTVVPNLYDGSDVMLVWTGPQPGRSVLLSALPAVALLSLLLAGVFLVLMLRARKVAHELATSEANARELAARDYLTGLSNRGHFIDALEDQLGRLGPDDRLALLFVDLDDFKAINDGAGHGAGDALLKAVGLRLQAAVGEEGLVGRFGGDEFVVFFRAASAGAVDALLERVMSELEPPVPLDTEKVRVSASIGVAQAPGDGTVATDLLRRADIALYRAKEEGGGTIRRFEAQQESEQNARREIATALSGATERGEMVLIYQPQVEVASGRVVGFETLLRWDHPTQGRLLPAQFIAVAEEMHIISALDLYGLRRACVEAAALPGMSISVNMSPVTLRSHGFIAQVRGILNDTGFDPEALEIEVTEGMVLRPTPETARTFEALRTLGVRIALDDFGTGYTSLLHVRRFPISRIKIDRSFVLRVVTDPEIAAVVEYKLRLARSLGLDMTAEGVETREQLRFLRDIGMPMAQGYLFSPPLPIAAAVELLKRQAEMLPGPLVPGP
ncbi:EAL domain-containing protein [Xanthobacter sp. KR7-65]|uniref:putative bifunctional diguanylate cyclase/phosphodiesterase n=1 Tax=Xanthobacter sp. KR7-65 TaxID=3156612 RepID=UPI0032B4BEF9